MLLNEDGEEFDVELYRPDLNFITQTNKYKFKVLDASIQAKMRALDIIKKEIQTSIEANSLPSSRNSSTTRTGNVRNAVDSMKPQILVYNTATLIQVSDHLTSVRDWMMNMYPEKQ